MANKSKKDNKNVIIGCVCAGLVAIIAIVVAIAVATSGGSGALSDSYFVSDDTKYVLTMETDEATLEDEETADYIPLKTHFVYTYEGDTVTGMKAYYEYGDAATAKKALEVLQSEENGDEFADATVDGKYVVVPAPAEQYEGMTTSDVKAQIEFVEALKNMDLDDSETDETEEVEETEDEE